MKTTFDLRRIGPVLQDGSIGCCITGAFRRVSGSEASSEGRGGPIPAADGAALERKTKVLPVAPHSCYPKKQLWKQQQSNCCCMLRR